MIDLYTWGTPNGRRVSILLEELGLDYEVLQVVLAKGEQFSASLNARFPSSKIPAITDRATGVSLMESGAILTYLATKADKPNADEPNTMQWLMWQMGGFGLILGQFMHFNSAPEGKA